MPKYLPDDDEGEIRLDLVEILLALAVAVIVAPGVIWWAATFLAFFTGKNPL